MLFLFSYCFFAPSKSLFLMSTMLGRRPRNKGRGEMVLSSLFCFFFHISPLYLFFCLLRFFIFYTAPPTPIRKGGGVVQEQMFLFAYRNAFPLPPSSCNVKMIRMTISDVRLSYLYKIETFIAFLNSFLNHYFNGDCYFTKVYYFNGECYFTKPCYSNGEYYLTRVYFILFLTILIMTILN